MSARVKKHKDKGKSKRIGFGPRSDKSKGGGSRLSSGFKVGRQALKNVNGPTGHVGVGHGISLGNNFDVLHVSNKLGNGKHKAVRLLSGGKSEILKGKENNAFVFGGHGQGNFDPKCSLDLDKRGQHNYMSTEVIDKLGNSLVEVGVAIEDIVAAIDNIVEQNANDNQSVVVGEKMDAECGGNLINSLLFGFYF